MSQAIIIALSRIGDMFQCFPAFSDFNRFIGGKGINVLAQKEYAPVAELHGAVMAIPFDGDAILNSLRMEKDWAQKGMETIRSLTDAIEEIHPRFVVNLTHTAFSANLCGMIGGYEKRGRVAHPRGVMSFNGDWTKYFFTLLNSRNCNPFNIVDINREITGGIIGEEDSIKIPFSAQEFAKQRLQSYHNKFTLALGIGANHPLRRLSAERWAETVQIINRFFKVHFVLVGGSDEKDIGQKIERNTPDNCLNLCGETDPLQLAAVINECDAYIGHDSGPLHIAAALKKPCLGIYLAMASVWETAPYVANALTIEPNIACHPCPENGRCNDPQCHLKITPDVVAHSLMCMLKNDPMPNSKEVRIRKTTFDESHFLNLVGNQTYTGDSLRFLWRKLLPNILTSWQERRSVVSSLPSEFPLQAELLEMLNEMKGDVIQLTQNFMQRLYRSDIARDKSGFDTLYRAIPALISKYPQFRPVFDLFSVECLEGETTPAGSRLEKVVSAQEKLLQRVSIIADWALNRQENNLNNFTDFAESINQERLAV